MFTFRLGRTFTTVILEISVCCTLIYISLCVGMNLNASRTNFGTLTTSSSYVQRSQGNTIEQSSSYVSNARSNYPTVEAHRVRAYGDGLLRAYRNEKATFTVDTRDGGKIIY